MPDYVPIVVAAGVAAGAVTLASVIRARRLNQRIPSSAWGFVVAAAVSGGALVGLALVLPRDVSFVLLLAAILSVTLILVFIGVRTSRLSGGTQQLRLWLVVGGGILSLVIWLAAGLR